MNGYIPWTIPINVDEALVPSVVSTLIQSGIKLFLHQRNQIPVPVEQLGKRLVHHEQELTGHDGGVEEEVAEEDNDNEAGIRRRIQEVISRRKKRHNNVRKIRISKMILQGEEKALKSIMDTLAVLNEQTLGKLRHILTVGLFFGPSLRSSKEIIFFDTSMCSMEEYECVNGITTIPNDSLVSVLTRSFHKTVIMSEDFCEMTTQSLRSTRTHVCVLARTELSSTEANEDNSVVLLDDADIFNDYFLLKESNESETDESSVFVTSVDSSSSTLNSSSSSTSTTPPLRVTDRRKSKKRVLLIKLILQDRKDNKRDRSIDSIREKFLFCYQIPLRLKGIVSCKNTQM